MEKKLLSFEKVVKAVEACAASDDGACNRCPAQLEHECITLVFKSLQARIEVLKAEKARADRLAEKVKTLETENVLLKDALHKMGTAAQKDNGETKRDMVNYLCTEMGGDCTDCPVRKNDLAYYICASKPFEEFTETELDTLLACFERTDEML